MKNKKCLITEEHSVYVDLFHCCETGLQSCTFTYQNLLQPGCTIFDYINTHSVSDNLTMYVNNIIYQKLANFQVSIFSKLKLNKVKKRNTMLRITCITFFL